MDSAPRRPHLQISVQSTKRETARLGMRGGVVGQIHLHWKQLLIPKIGRDRHKSVSAIPQLKEAITIWSTS